MTRVAALIGIVVACSLGLASRSFASDPVSGVLPSGAQLLSVAALPSDAHRYAVAYRTNQPYLAVVSTASPQTILWSRRLPASPSRLVAPGPAGLFLAIVRRTGSSATVYAYHVRGSSVSSAIAGRPGGSVSGDEGVSLKSREFAVRNRDPSHQGSVRYRLVSHYLWKSSLYRKDGIQRVPDYPAASYPQPNGVVHTHTGDVILIRLEIANTEPLREKGLMYRKSLDPDSGMVFVWDSGRVHEAFWMENTYIPLTVAFMDADGRIMETQDMEPQTTTYHIPQLPYQYALEVNKGFFASNGIQVGDRIELHLGS